MDPISQFLEQHAALAIAIGFALHFGKDFLRDFLARDAAAKLADNDPSNDKVARAEQAGVTILDKVPDPTNLIAGKK